MVLKWENWNQRNNKVLWMRIAQEKWKVISGLVKKRQQKCWGPDPKNLATVRTTCARHSYKLSVWLSYFGIGNRVFQTGNRKLSPHRDGVLKNGNKHQWLGAEKKQHSELSLIWIWHVSKLWLKFHVEPASLHLSTSTLTLWWWRKQTSLKILLLRGLLKLFYGTHPTLGRESLPHWRDDKVFFEWFLHFQRISLRLQAKKGQRKNINALWKK